MGSCGRDVAKKRHELAVALDHVANLPPRQEAVPQVSHGALDATLLLRRSDGAQPRLYAEDRGHLDHRRVEAHRVTLAPEHDRLRVIEEPLPRGAAEEGVRADERAPQRHRGQVPDALGEEHPRPTQHHHEEPQITAPAGHVALPDEGPIDLSLLADEILQAQEGAAARDRAHPRDVATQGAHRALVATVFQHVVEARRAQPRVALQRLGDEVHVERNARLAGVCRDHPSWRSEPRHAKHPVVMDAQLRLDRADLPVLGEEEATDLGLGLGRESHSAPPAWGLLRRHA